MRKSFDRPFLEWLILGVVDSHWDPFKKERVFAEPPDTAGYEVVDDRIIDHLDWTVVHEVIFRDPDEAYWRTKYLVPATETNDCAPWQENPVACEQVKPVAKQCVVFEALE